MVGLGRTVIGRQRMARLWALGDRTEPLAWAPGLVISADDDYPASIAPFQSSTDGGLPARLTISARVPMAPWENSGNGPVLSASIGHVLPPSLDEADAGEVSEKNELLPISWQSLCHDEELMKLEVEPHIIVLTDALQLANKPGRLIEAIQLIKIKFPGSLLWAPGLGGPDNCAVLSWFGIDLFDLTRSKQAQSNGAILTMNGPRLSESSLEPDVDHWALAIAETRRAIRDGTLRELAQKQSLSSPRLVEHLRRHDTLMASQKGVLSQVVDAKRSLRIHSADEHNDPIIVDWVRYISEDYIAPSSLDDVLVLLPCSARKPYSLSRTHRAFRRSMGHNAAHEVMVTSPLGLVPRDLEECWPAGHYDIPVTGDWNLDEIKRIHEMLDSLVKRMNYRVIINHSGLEYHNENIEIIDTRMSERSTSNEALERLNSAVLEHVKIKRRSGEKMNQDNFASVARMHHHNDTWLNGSELRGRFPRWKIFVDDEQIAMWAPERGGFSLSKAALPILHKHDSLPRLSLKSGIKWKGDINLANIDSWDEDIRAGQDILVMQDGELVGSARASAPSWEWRSTPGRLAKMHQRL